MVALDEKSEYHQIQQDSFYQDHEFYRNPFNTLDQRAAVTVIAFT